MIYEGLGWEINCYNESVGRIVFLALLGDKMEIKYVTKEDKEFWFQLDKHLPEAEFEKKVRDKQGYVIFEDGKPVGL